MTITIKEVQDLVTKMVRVTKYECTQCYSKFDTLEEAGAHTHPKLRTMHDCVYLTSDNVNVANTAHKWGSFRDSKFTLKEVWWEGEGWYREIESRDYDGDRNDHFARLDGVLEKREQDLKDCIYDIRAWREVLRS